MYGNEENMDISLGGYAGSIADVYGSNIGSGSAISDSVANKDFNNATDEELMDVCKQFESYLLEQVFKGMEKMIPKSEDENSSASKTVDYFKDTMRQELATQSTDIQGLGLAQMLYESMKREYSI